MQVHQIIPCTFCSKKWNKKKGIVKTWRGSIVDRPERHCCAYYSSFTCMRSIVHTRFAFDRDKYRTPPPSILQYSNLSVSTQLLSSACREVLHGKPCVPLQSAQPRCMVLFLCWRSLSTMSKLAHKEGLCFKGTLYQTWIVLGTISNGTLDWNHIHKEMNDRKSKT